MVIFTRGGRADALMVDGAHNRGEGSVLVEIRQHAQLLKLGFGGRGRMRAARRGA